jgi:hypothetical protein
MRASQPNVFTPWPETARDYAKGTWCPVLFSTLERSESEKFLADSHPNTENDCIDSLRFKIRPMTLDRAGPFMLLLQIPCSSQEMVISKRRVI